MANVFDVARYIIKNCEVSNLKLQKLMYYSQAVYMVQNNGQALFDENIEAWDYGPVVPSIYRKYKENGFDIIKSEDDSPCELNYKEITSIDMVLAYYGEMSSVALVARTHSEDPWKNAYKPNSRNIIISKDSIYEYFKETLEFSN